jgi:hypothetical protein
LRSRPRDRLTGRIRPLPAKIGVYSAHNCTGAGKSNLRFLILNQRMLATLAVNRRKVGVASAETRRANALLSAALVVNLTESESRGRLPLGIGY